LSAPESCRWTATSPRRRIRWDTTANTAINQTGQAIEGIAIIMLVDLTINLVISGFMNWYNRRFALGGSKP
jgi:ABC-type amino acid transport system permease subunit